MGVVGAIAPVVSEESPIDAQHLHSTVLRESRIFADFRKLHSCFQILKTRGSVYRCRPKGSNTVDLQILPWQGSKSRPPAWPM